MHPPLIPGDFRPYPPASATCWCSLQRGKLIAATAGSCAVIGWGPYNIYIGTTRSAVTLRADRVNPHHIDERPTLDSHP